MPFRNVQELESSGIQGIENLSEREKRVFLNVFNDMVYNQGASEKEAIPAAMSQAQKKGAGGHKERR